MSRASGPTTCLKHNFALGDATVVVDWRQIKRSMPAAEDEDAAQPSKSSSVCFPKFCSSLASLCVILNFLANFLLFASCILKNKSEKPGAPGKGAAKFASLIQELEAKHIGRKAGAEYGYERDGFVVSDVRIELCNVTDLCFFTFPLCKENFL